MKAKTILPLALLLLTDYALAAEHYTEAQITQVESSDYNIILFLQWISGDALPTGNGGSNEAASKPYLFLANSSADIANRKHFLSSALVAQTQGTVVRLRWDDAAPNTNRIVVMLQR